MTDDNSSWSYFNPTTWFYYSPYNPLSWASSEVPKEQQQNQQQHSSQQTPQGSQLPSNTTPQGKKLEHLNKARPNQLNLKRKPRGRDHKEKRNSILKQEEPQQHSAPSLRISPHPPPNTSGAGPMGFGVSLNDIQGFK
eukprot:CAMPEP_0206198510 /NCGR_PEP_ID=MMETSP0166-20121206/9685_1 /ASSEMBLY_ACC=CAM_ASM_000260 /TAXON_ID=95228 /ORGANISM="Vannella robusta, Strain DIVA3 518/3/11/1/6" /LENGTH=137 /DNA_ID=CAMNT_0053616387 /DNA_START=31 /DNA_END=441 /DNA_ORIENTATION=+